ncbi:MAG: GlcNAc-PI de-N-acetylase [Rickettsiales bacterium TMED174]|nr:MAG: GlcNAc-PI de-N-acetylase [Rickettsiales bacterium TMED174]|tara:strand:+ start:237 stop:899 length:663 start_codon:yes stop_codon:yes gene_type:complete
MSKVLFVSPHPDDETLGCGGTIFYHKKKGDDIFLLIITNLSIEFGWSEKLIERRKKEIDKIKKFYGFKNVFHLNFQTKYLDTVPINEIIENISNIVKKTKSKILYIPSRDDVHTDHQIVSKACMSSIKWFRNPSVKKVMAYEVISETNFNFDQNNFKPNVFIDITPYITKKIAAMKIYKSEIKKHPFPRSEDAIKSLAILRGSQSGKKFAEAFQLYMEIL